jgi:glyoxylase-like metal-dependent hydrolase (beta-lactamase superfamily II)
MMAVAGTSGASEAAGAAPGASVEPGDFPSTYSRMIGPVSALQVRTDVWVLSAGDINTVLETGPDGAIVVDPGPEAGAAQMIQAIRAITSAPIRYIINTGPDAELTGADQAVSAAGFSFLTNDRGRFAPVLLRQNAVLTMASSPETLSTAREAVLLAFARPQLSYFVNGQSVHIMGQPAGHTNGDAVVQFQRSDVVVTGELFDDTGFPNINRSAGGSLQGEIDALNGLVNGIVSASQPVVGRPAGPWLQAPPVATVVIPVRGPLCDQQDLATYRDMVTIVEQRVSYLVKQHKSEAQVLAADPLQGFDTRYTYGGKAAALAFVKASYQSLVSSAAGKHE